MRPLVPYFFALSFSIFVAVFGIFWLAAGILGVTAVVFAISKWENLRKGLQKHTFLSGFMLLFAVILFAVLLRIFVFEIYSIPSGSMEKTLVPGDKIVVSKLAFGPALPRSPLEVPWFNTFFLLNKQAIAKNDTFVWNYHRLPGLRSIQRGDVIVFRYPPDPHENYIKRCIALPGDTVQVKNSILYVNGIRQAFPFTAKIEYKVWHPDFIEFQHLVDSLHLPVTGPWYRKQNNYLVLNLTISEVALLRKVEQVDSISVYVSDGTITAYGLSIADTNQHWSTDNYGPLVVPRKGMSIPVDETNLEKYKTALQNYEHFLPEKTENGYLLNGSPVTDYTFRQNYYFMMGDNRHRSNDSRMWGTVPEELITGKAVVVLWSGGLKHFRWRRVMKKIE